MRGVVGCVLVVLLLTACAAPSTPVPPGLEKFYGQRLTWTGCADVSSHGGGDTRCARLAVPLDYAHPDGPEVSLGVLRVAAKDREHRIGSVVVNPGGPGSSGIEKAASVASSGLSRRFDVVGFDQRGLGASDPRLDCPPTVTPDYGRQCADRTRYGSAMLAGMSTDNLARDLDVLRAALGEETLNYVGFSYGTRVGTVYAGLFPRSIRAMVLDGAVDPTQTHDEFAVTQRRGVQAAFNRFAAWCATQADCPLRTDPVREFQALTRPLLTQPIVSDGQTLDYDSAISAVVGNLTSGHEWSPLLRAIADLARHDGAAMLRLAAAVHKSATAGQLVAISTAVRCADDPRGTGAAAHEAAMRAAAPFTDPGVPPDGFDACASWPAPSSYRPLPTELAHLPQTLVVSSTDDPSTPYESGVRLAEALHARLLTVVDDRHTAFLRGNKCVDDAALEYLTSLHTPDFGTRCQL